LILFCDVCNLEGWAEKGSKLTLLTVRSRPKPARNRAEKSIRKRPLTPS
jgi:hypothetical protein